VHPCTRPPANRDRRGRAGPAREQRAIQGPHRPWFPIPASRGALPCGTQIGQPKCELRLCFEKCAPGARFRAITQLLGQFAERREPFDPRAHEVPQARLELGHGLLDFSRLFGLHGDKRGVGVPALEPRRRVGPNGALHPTVAAGSRVQPNRVDDAVANQRCEPATEPVLRFPCELRQVFEDAAENLLHDVAGAEPGPQPRPPDAGVPGEADVNLAFHAGLKTTDELREGVRFPGASPREQRREGAVRSILDSCLCMPHGGVLRFGHVTSPRTRYPFTAAKWASSAAKSEIPSARAGGLDLPWIRGPRNACGPFAALGPPPTAVHRFPNSVRNPLKPPRGSRGIPRALPRKGQVSGDAETQGPSDAAGYTLRDLPGQIASFHPPWARATAPLEPRPTSAFATPLP